MPQMRKSMLNRGSLLIATRIVGGLMVLMGLIGLILAPFISEALFPKLWTVEPLAYIGAVVLMVGLGITSLTYAVAQALTRKSTSHGMAQDTSQQWSQTTQQYFELFDHDLGRPLRRILGKERELRAIQERSGTRNDPAVRDLLNEIESQAPNFRLMMSNIQVLVQLENPSQNQRSEPAEPTEIVRKIVDRYTAVAAEQDKEITWWAEPAEFGIVYSDGSAIDHVVTNLVDNAVRFATSHVEIKITRNPSHFFFRVWDDGQGVAAQYLQHIFDRGWTPEVARREEKPSSGLGLFIARTLASRYAGELTVESVALPDPNHHTAFLLSLPLRKMDVTLP